MRTTIARATAGAPARAAHGRGAARVLTAALAAASLATQGCVGLAAVTRGSAPVAIHRPMLRMADGTTQPETTADELRRAWGNPRRQRIGTLGGSEWVYRCGLKWRGLGLLFAVLPVPLFLPTGLHQVRVEMRDDRVVVVRGDVGATTARAGCMWGPLADDGPACRVFGRPAAVREIRCGRDATLVDTSAELAPTPQP